MALAKGKRNALIVKLWNEGKGNQEILTRLKRAGYKDLANTHSLSGVISRLKRSGKLPKERPGQELTKIEREGIRDLERDFGGAIKFQVDLHYFFNRIYVNNLRSERGEKCQE
jgi:hypothetical protein